MKEKIGVPSSRALARERLDGWLDIARQRRLTLVVAPAGSGKTTLLARFSDTTPGPVAWYRADAGDASEEQALTYLDAAFAEVLPELVAHGSVDELVADIGARAEPVRLVVDDLHALYGTPAEAVIDRLVRYFPRNGMVLAASRRAPGFDVSRLRLSGELLEIGGDDLRFRTWEVERLFRDLYGDPLAPNELAELARRTQGWAAGLQLFHLATHDKPAHVRRDTLAALSSRSRLVREYLARNVLDDLPAELRTFLLDTCVLVDPTPPLCDSVRGRSGSGDLLAELARRQIFTTPLDDCGTYRYHEVLRNHLLGILLEQLGEGELRRRFAAAGTALEEDGRVPEAVAAYARAGASDALGRVLGRAGADLASDPGDWLRSLPESVREHDPWVMLAAARWHLMAGRPEPALAEYRRAEEQFGTGPGAEVCRGERTALARFLAPHPVPPSPGPDPWDVVLRRSLRHRPLELAEPRDSSPTMNLAAGLAALLAGYPGRARTHLEGAAFDAAAAPMVAAASRLAAAIAPHFAPGAPPAPSSIVSVAKEAEAVGGRWLGDVAAACLALTGEDSAVDASAHALAASSEAPLERDPWSTLLGHWTCGVGCLHRDPERSLEHFEVVERGSRDVGAPVLEAWALAGAAYAAVRAGLPDALDRARHAESASRQAGVPGARAVAYAALTSVSSSPEEHGRLFEALVDECGLAIRLPAPVDSVPVSSAGDTVEVRCLGGLHVTVDDQRLDLETLKPRWRSLLAILALHGGEGVHREALVDALWPESDRPAGVRRLQVAVSGLRGCFQRPENEPLGASVVRIGDAYALRLATEATYDHVALRELLDQGRRARERGDRSEGATLLQQALELYRGELLPEEGAADWVVDQGDRCRQLAADIAWELATVLADLGNLEGADRAAAQGLAIDRYRDDLWQLRLAVLERSGRGATLERTRAAYDAVLAELGVTSSDL